MSRKIVVEPTFCEGHFLDAHIKNVCDYLKPDIFVLAEGMFPKGPESNIKDVEKFKDTYTLDGHRGFDYELVQQIIDDNKKLYPNTDIRLIEMNYPIEYDANHAYFDAYTSFRNIIDVKPDDIIFPLESDLFFSKQQADTILQLISILKPDEGYGSTFKLFFESPKVNIPGYHGQGRKRKLVYKYGAGKLCEILARGNAKESYHAHLKWVDLQLFHYEWMRPGKYWDMRFTQLNRPAHVYALLKNAKELIQHFGINADIKILKQSLEAMKGWDGSFTLSTNSLSKKDHPKHIWNHPNFIKYFGNEKNNN